MRMMGCKQGVYLTFACVQLVPAVTELMVAELLYLEKQGATLPIEMLINSSGTTRQDGEIVGLLLWGMLLQDVLMRNNQLTMNAISWPLDAARI
jgi:ATP-dependent protease ClpP protease subunit